MERQTEQWEMRVITNSFPITRIPSAVYFQYDEITPPCLSKRRNYEIMDRVQKENADMFNPRPIFDGRNNLYSTQRLQATIFDVHMSRLHQEPTHRVEIKGVAMINADAVRLLMQRYNPNAPMLAKSLNLLQLIIRQAPNITHGFPAHAKSFFDLKTAKDLSIGLSVWRGYFQSVRPSLGSLLINVDVSHALFYNHGPLLDLMMDHLGVDNVRKLYDLQPNEFRKLRSFLKGVMVSFTVAPQMRPRPISELINAAGLQEFDKDKDGVQERVTVQLHFEEKYGIPMQYPECVGVRVGKNAIIPAEFCLVVPGQMYRKQISHNVRKEVMDVTRKKPDLRISGITAAVHSDIFNYQTSDYMREAGMEVSANPVELKGIVLPPPDINLSLGDTVKLRDKAGSWNLKGHKLYRPAHLGSWMVVCYYRADKEKVQGFVRQLSNTMVNLGMTIPLEPPQLLLGNESNPTRILEDSGKVLKPDLVLCIMPKYSVELRRAVKHWGDCYRGVSTQCVMEGKWESARDQYCANVALKINSRLEGVGWTIKEPGLSDFLGSAMIIGADVGHPSSGVTNRPSVAGFVASLDPEATVMTSYHSVQQPRQEIIEDLEEMVDASLNDWFKWRIRAKLGPQGKQPPKVIVFYRDGVSEGEYDRLAQYEIPKIKNAFRKMRGSTPIPEQLWPKIIFIVAVKRHHVRFFAANPQDADRSGNCPAGLLVQDTITSPHVVNFFLQSHAGLLGTSRPTHYSVLLNEAQLGLPQIQKLTFYLCHTYATTTRSVSIPAPLFYAHRLCTRLPIFCENGASLSDVESNDEFDLDGWKRTAGLGIPALRLQLKMPFI